jgi:receptor protein-tyrosine kinase
LIIFSHPASGKRQGTRKSDLSGSLVTLSKPLGSASEAYRTLRATLLYAFPDDPPRAVVVSSPGSREGKTTTCANLAVVLAQGGKNVLVVDGDLRKPELHKFFSLQNTYGLVDVLMEERALEDVCYESVPQLKVLTSGPVPPNPADLLGSQRFAGFMRRVREGFDYVLVDAPPVGLVSDTAILAAHSDGVLLVIDTRKTRKWAVRQSMRSLKAIGVNVLATVMNRVEAPNDDYYGDGDGHHYHY